MSHVGYDVEKYGTLNHAPIYSADQQHPRFNEYLRYRSAMTAQLVNCYPFASWLSDTERNEQGSVNIFQAGEKCDPDVYTAGKWYIGHTQPNTGKWRSYGPFDTEAIAREQSTGMRGRRA